MVDADDQTVTATRQVVAVPPFVVGLSVPRYLERADQVRPKGAGRRPGRQAARRREGDGASDPPAVALLSARLRLHRRRRPLRHRGGRREDRRDHRRRAARSRSRCRSTCPRRGSTWSSSRRTTGSGARRRSRSISSRAAASRSPGPGRRPPSSRWRPTRRATRRARPRGWCSRARSRTARRWRWSRRRRATATSGCR